MVDKCCGREAWIEVGDGVYMRVSSWNRNFEYPLRACKIGPLS